MAYILLPNELKEKQKEVDKYRFFGDVYKLGTPEYIKEYQNEIIEYIKKQLEYD